MCQDKFSEDMALELATSIYPFDSFVSHCGVEA